VSGSTAWAFGSFLPPAPARPLREQPQVDTHLVGSHEMHGITGFSPVAAQSCGRPGRSAAEPRCRQLWTCCCATGRGDQTADEHAGNLVASGRRPRRRRSWTRCCAISGGDQTADAPGRAAVRSARRPACRQTCRKPRCQRRRPPCRATGRGDQVPTLLDVLLCDRPRRPGCRRSWTCCRASPLLDVLLCVAAPGRAAEPPAAETTVPWNRRGDQVADAPGRAAVRSARRPACRRTRRKSR
jgi:hypothetical protein